MAVTVVIQRNDDDDHTPFIVLAGLAAAAKEAIEEDEEDKAMAMINAIGSMSMEWHDKFMEFEKELKGKKH